MSLRQIVMSSSPIAVLRRRRQAGSLRQWLPEDERRYKFYSQFIQSNDLVFDVGANLGNRTKVFLRLGARVVAFEPQSSCADILEAVLGGNPSFHLVREALGDKAGMAEMLVGDAHVLSTLSPQWVQTARQSGRFGKEQWRARQQVVVTTLEQSIAEYGRPAFIKIDVEGFEPQVLSGLDSPLARGSIEFAAEAIDGTISCLEKLATLQPCSFQLSMGEEVVFVWPQWQPLDHAVAALRKLIEADPLAWGDVYFAADYLLKH